MTFTLREASKVSGVKVRTLRSWIQKGILKADKNANSRFLMIKEEELEKAMEERKMAVRNFYLKANIDGYKTMLKGGPRRKDGGMEVTILQRDIVAFIISSYERDGILYTDVMDKDRKVISTFKTER